MKIMRRRAFAQTLLAASGSACLTPMRALLGADGTKKPEICAFIKFVQDLPPAELARRIRQLGFDGIEATVRKKGQVEPTEVEDKLPGLCEALKGEGLSMTIMASDVTRADDRVMEKTLRAAAAQGVTRYRMGYYRYDLKKPIRPQLENFRPMVRELAALNQELGLQAVYQNHAGAANVGASVWDLDLLFEGIPTQQMAVGFDVRHATVEGGTTWSTLWKLIEPRLGAVYVKDFVWETEKVVNVALGEGRVSPKFFSGLANQRVDLPFTVHVEYLRSAGIEENLAALKRDRERLLKLLNL